MSSEGTAAVAVPAGRRERKKRELRRRIYRTARDLFLARGVEATTVEQIAAAADIAPATFFNHFHSKSRLVGEMTGEVSGRLETLVEECLMSAGTTAARIARFADRAAAEIGAAGSVAHDVLLDLIRSSERPGTLVPYLPRVHEAFTGILRDGQRAGHVRADLEAGFLAEAVVGVLNGALINWMNDVRYPLAERLREAAAFVAEMIEPRRGIPPVARETVGRVAVTRRARKE
jgi:AcrR family transcriptional regulator